MYRRLRACSVTTFALVLLAAAALAAPLLADAPKEASKPDGSKGKKPRLDLRSSPRMGFSPVHVLLTAEFIGGDDIEEYHCPEIEWEWDDGGKSVEFLPRQHVLRERAVDDRFAREVEHRRNGGQHVRRILDDVRQQPPADDDREERQRAEQRRRRERLHRRCSASTVSPQRWIVARSTGRR